MKQVIVNGRTITITHLLAHTGLRIPSSADIIRLLANMAASDKGTNWEVDHLDIFDWNYEDAFGNQIDPMDAHKFGDFDLVNRRSFKAGQRDTVVVTWREMLQIGDLISSNLTVAQLEVARTLYDDDTTKYTGSITHAKRALELAKAVA